MCPKGRTFQAEGTANAKAWGGEQTWLCGKKSKEAGGAGAEWRAEGGGWAEEARPGEAPERTWAFALRQGSLYECVCT